MMNRLFKVVVLDALTRVADAWNESLHKRDARGRFVKTKAGAGASKPSNPSKVGKGKKVKPADAAYAKLTGKPIGKLLKERMAKSDLDATNERELHQRLDKEIGSRLRETSLAQARRIDGVENYLKNIASHGELCKILKAWGGDPGKRGEGISGNELAARALKLLAGESASKKPKTKAPATKPGHDQ